MTNSEQVYNRIYNYHKKNSMLHNGFKTRMAIYKRRYKLTGNVNYLNKIEDLIELKRESICND